MCIIVAKPEKVKLTQDRIDILQECWINNPDGAGMMFPQDDSVFISKGFMEYEDFNDYIIKNKKLLNSKTVIFHFRFATHGETYSGNCHPFPVTSDVEELTMQETNATLAIAHNGIIPNMPKNKTHSDSLIFVKDYLAPLEDKLFEKDFGNLLVKLTGSKFAIMSPTKTTLMGEFIEDKEMYFSNTTYKPTVWIHKYQDMDWDYTRWNDTTANKIDTCAYDDKWESKIDVYCGVCGTEEAVMCEECSINQYFSDRDMEYAKWM